jgi:hypothetical protein
MNQVGGIDNGLQRDLRPIEGTASSRGSRSGHLCAPFFPVFVGFGLIVAAGRFLKYFLNLLGEHDVLPGKGGEDSLLPLLPFVI